MADSSAACPVNGTLGKPVKTITLKALLTPQALATLEPHESYRFCPAPDCPTVYYSSSRTYSTADLNVPVLHKDPGADVPVCFCFSHTRRTLGEAVLQGAAPQVLQSIRAHLQAGRCGCEVRNPQGSCCLGNVTRVLAALEKERA